MRLNRREQEELNKLMNQYGAFRTRDRKEYERKTKAHKLSSFTIAKGGVAIHSNKPTSFIYVGNNIYCPRENFNKFMRYYENLDWVESDSVSNVDRIRNELQSTDGDIDEVQERLRSYGIEREDIQEIEDYYY